jgi:hypothetical protein
MTVKRIKDSVADRNLGKITLYRNDLELISNAVAEVGPLKIICGEYEGSDATDFTRLREVEGLPERIPGIVLEASNPNTSESIEVNLDRRSAHIVLRNPSTLSRGAALQIQELCDNRQRAKWLRPRNLIFGELILIIISLVLLMLLLDWDAYYEGSNPYYPWAPIVGGLTGAGLIVLLIVGLLRLQGVSSPLSHGAILINEYREMRPGFIQRTRDDWVVSLTASAIGTVLGLIAGYVLGRLTDH